MLCWVSAATAQVSIGIGLPGVSIGINLPSYPQLVVVPDYPVYYAPSGDVNLFFYDGMYWAYQRDNWYASSRAEARAGARAGSGAGEGSGAREVVASRQGPRRRDRPGRAVADLPALDLCPMASRGPA